MAKTSHPRRGGCPHPPGRSGARAGGLYVSSHRSCPSGPGAMWASPPTQISGCCRSTEPGLIRKGSPPHPALRGHLLQAGEGMGLLVLGCRKIYGLSHSSWPGSLGGLGPPHPSRAAPGPPSPWGKATSRRGMLPSANSDLSCFFPQKTLYWTQLQRKGRKDHEHGFQTQADHSL